MNGTERSGRDALRALRRFWTDGARDGWDDVQWTAQDVLHQSRLPWLQIHFPWPVPYDAMLAEARGVHDLMVSHRRTETTHGYTHQGWRSICVHGLSARLTEHCSIYGLTDDEAAPRYTWTEIAERCPVTRDFFANTFGFRSFDRIRFMLLEPGGYILPHRDTDRRKLGPINIALNNPAGCEFRMHRFGQVPFASGTAFYLDVSNEHAVWNRSGEDRYHIIVHGDSKREVWDGIERTSAERMRTLGGRWRGVISRLGWLAGPHSRLG